MRLNLFSRLRAARSGSSAVEFALIAPMVVLLLFGLIELAEGTNCRQRMENVASTTADLVAQTATMTNAGTSNVFAAAEEIMFPYSNDLTEITFSSLVDDGTNSNTGRVVWSDASNATPRAANTTVPNLPPGLITPGGSVIMAEVAYTFTSPIGELISAPITMHSTFYTRPRRSVTVARVP